MTDNPVPAFRDVQRLYGCKDINRLFYDGAPQTTLPFKRAPRGRGPVYDKDAYAVALRDTGNHLSMFDPRELMAILQGNVTRSGVNYYMGSEYERSGKTFADQSMKSNEHPTVYVRANGQKIILTGHHRAVAALLKGEQLRALRVDEPVHKNSSRDADALSGRASPASDGVRSGGDRRPSAGRDRGGWAGSATRGLVGRGGGGTGSADGRRTASGGTTSMGEDWVPHVAVDAGNSAMVAFVPPSHVAEALLLPEGEKKKELHVTLAFLGKDLTADQKDTLHEAVHAFSEGASPMSGQYTGADSFDNSDSDGDTVIIAGMDMPGLKEWQQNLVDLLKEEGLSPSEKHDFTPHTTLKYVDTLPDELPEVPTLDVTFDAVWVCIADEWTEYPLEGQSAKVAGKNGDLPEGLTFKRVDLPSKGWRAIDAWLVGSIVGSIHWTTYEWDNPGEITDITIVDSMQRRGIGTELLRQARQWDPRVHHSTNLTGDGRAWSRVVAGLDYGGGHQPPRDSAFIYDLANEEIGSFPSDVYDHPEWYWHSGEAYDRESARVIKQVRGKPEAMVTIYRAAPPGVARFDTGNWVAVSQAYARQHAAQDDDVGNDWPVYSASVSARTLRSGGNDIVEYGYWGPPISARKVGSLGGVEASRAFDRSIIRTWESTRPWAKDREWLEAQREPGIFVGKARGSETASYVYGKIVLKDDWFAQNESARRAVLYHEAGHAIMDFVRIFDLHDSPLDIIKMPGAQGLGYNYDEVIAEGYSALWCDPDWYVRNRADEVKALVLDAVKKAGFPLPSGTRAGSKVAGIYDIPQRRSHLWRGLNVKFPPDLQNKIRRLNEPPMEENEIDQHLKIGPLVLDYLQSAYSDAWGKVGLGRHWTANRHMAEIGAMQGAHGGWNVILEIKDEGQKSDPDATGQGEIYQKSGTESEVNLLPGTRVTVTGVFIEGLGYMRNLNLLGQPMRKTAASGIEALVSQFAAENPDLRNSNSAYDQCVPVSEEFAALLKHNGVSCEVISGVRYGEFMGHRVVAGGHFAVQVGNDVYDWTIRQFEPNASVPKVCSIVEWRAQWEKLGVVGSKHDNTGIPDSRGYGEGGGVRRYAGPASGRVRRDRILSGVTGRDARRARPVIIEGNARGDFARLDRSWQARCKKVLKAIEAGQAQPEQKQRPPLQDCFSVRIDSVFRIIFFIGIDGSYHVFYFGFHDYEEAERRMGKTSSLPPGYTMRVGDKFIGSTLYLQITVMYGREQAAYLDMQRTPDRFAGDDSPAAQNARAWLVGMVKVEPEHRRKGLATEMYAELHRRYPGIPVLHSFGQGQSPDARALNRTLKERFGPRMHLGGR